MIDVSVIDYSGIEYGMTPQRLSRIRAVFEDVLAQPPGERDHYLKELSGVDSELREEVARLLAGHEESECIVDSPAIRGDVSLGNATRTIISTEPYRRR